VLVTISGTISTDSAFIIITILDYDEIQFLLLRLTKRIHEGTFGGLKSPVDSTGGSILNPPKVMKWAVPLPVYPRLRLLTLSGANLALTPKHHTNPWWSFFGLRSIPLLSLKTVCSSIREDVVALSLPAGSS
jgi:hypothetical protein